MSELMRESKFSPLALFALTFIVAGLGFVLIGPLIGFFLAIPFFEGGLTEQLSKLTNPVSYPEIRIPLFIIQGSSTLIGLAVMPSLLWFSIEQKGITSWFAGKKVYGVMIITILLMMVAFMVTDSFFIEWNAHLHLPGFLKDFELMARDYEDRAEVLTKYLLQLSSVGELVSALVVVAILPAFAEELLFRGMLQTQLARAVKNSHVSIWLTAILFSAFHLQFFGFVPRMLLGALFGYLYYWSGNLLMPMFAHFINNGLSVLGLYLNQKGILEMDVESTEAAPWPTLVSFALIAVVLLYFYKNFFDKKNLPDGR